VGPPDFVGIGVQKAGTTWWYDLVTTHPGVSSRADLHKERHFFDRFGEDPFGPLDLERYHGWFPRPAGTLAGEWTPDYFEYPWVPPLLKRTAPEARLLLMLRDPVERFRSGLAHQRRAGVPVNGPTIADALNRGFYHRGLLRWLEHFEPARILVLQHERCIVDLDTQMASTFAFLGLPEYRLSGSERPPVRPPAGVAPLEAELGRRLADLYAADVLALAERYPGVDLHLWPNFAYLVGGSPASA